MPGQKIIIFLLPPLLFLYIATLGKQIANEEEFMTRMRKIVLAVDTHLSHGRDICEGVLRFARPSMRWDFILTADRSEKLIDQVKEWDADAIIGEFGTEKQTQVALATERPAVNLYGGKPFAPGLLQVGTDDFAVGRMAADYFINRGFKQFAAFGLPGEGFQSGRLAGFENALQENHFHVDTLTDFAYGYKMKGRRDVPYDSDIHRWLKKLPKPVAILACDSMRAVWVADACRHLDIAVPDEISILGVDDDPLFCKVPYPPISAVRLSGVDEGYLAAKYLRERLAGRKGPAQPHLFAPRGIAFRQSTNFIAVEDENVRAALRFIEANARSGISVDDVVDESGISRRVLEKRFRTLLKTSPHREIRRVQMDYIKHLLSETDRKTDEIAEAAGFSSNIRLCAEFKKQTGMSPMQYRKKYRMR